MDREIRRVVTSNQTDGKEVVLFDGASPKVTARADGGLKSSLLWATDSTPADVSGVQDRADRMIGIPPPPGGSVFRIVDFYAVGDSALPADHIVAHFGKGCLGQGLAAGAPCHAPHA
jgi:hypothetical protein